jgi:hypothetical protein
MADVPLRYLLASVELRPCGRPDCAESHEASVFRLLDGTEVKEIRVGDVYVEPWALRRHRTEGKHSCPWTNCDGAHLIVHVPGKDCPHYWNVDARAGNCTKPNETTHRCWVRRGQVDVPETLHVDKGSDPRLTCAAGAGSIQVSKEAGGWHGFLDRGMLRVARSR